MKKLLLGVIAALCFSAPALATTWYVSSTIGGPRISTGNPGVASCTGQGTTPFNSSGAAGQSCPFQVFLWLYNDPYVYQNLQWIIAGGDTVIDLDVGSANANKATGTTGSFGVDCWGIGPGCTGPPIPSGTSGNHTKIFGANHGACSTTNAQGITVADPTKESFLWAGGGAGQLFDLESQYVDVACMQIRSHSSCNGINLSCSGTDWAQRGIWTGSTAVAGNITLTDMQITGFQSRGIIGNLGPGYFNLTNVEISFNGSAGWDLDPGTGSTRDSNNATVDMENTIISWNGCSREWPDVDAVPVQANSCTDDANGGYGDGIGTPPDVGILSWTLNHSLLSYNTQDAIDLGHLLSGTVIYKNNILFGNMGGALKVGNATVLTEFNNFTEANCTRMAQPITGVATGFNSHISDFCRAGGDQNTFNYDPTLGHTLTADIEFNTYVGTGGTVLDAQCFNGPCVAGTGYTFTFSNNAVYGVANGISSPTPPYPYNSGLQPSMWNNLSPTTEAKNLFYNLHSCPANGSDISPTCVLSPAFVGQPPATMTAESQLDNFNFYPNTGSALIHAATFNASVPTDYYSVSRPNPPTVGAAEPSGSTPTVATPTATPVAGTYGSTQTVTLSTTTGPATICYTTDGTTPTATTPGTCSHGTTYSSAITVSSTTTIMAIGTLSGYLNSSVASFTYTITAPTTTGITLTGIKISGSVKLQ